MGGPALGFGLGGPCGVSAVGADVGSGCPPISSHVDRMVSLPRGSGEIPESMHKWFCGQSRRRRHSRPLSGKQRSRAQPSPRAHCSSSVHAVHRPSIHARPSPQSALSLHAGAMSRSTYMPCHSSGARGNQRGPAGTDGAASGAARAGSGAGNLRATSGPTTCTRTGGVLRFERRTGRVSVGSRSSSDSAPATRHPAVARNRRLVFIRQTTAKGRLEVRRGRRRA